MTKAILILCGLFIAFSATSHPFDDPLTFIEHKTDDGRPIFTNIPKACFSKGRLTCQQLHPIYGMPVSTKKAASGPTKKKSVAQDKKPTKDMATSQLGCNIKGNISIESGEKIYHVPGGAWYEDTVVDELYGERWFCSKEEAEKAG